MPFIQSVFSLPKWHMSILTLFGALFAIIAPLQAAQPSTPWPQAGSDLKPDPGVRFGTLTNGMKFAIMHNTTPRGQVAIRFRVEAGSRDEDDDQRGLAHFLEHMAFRGSTHVTEDEMIGLLQRKGLTFGPDVNASTSFNETIYKLNIPDADTDTVSTGLMLMREIASELRLDAGALERERGVILAEERQRDTPQARADHALGALLLAGQLAPLRLPIGDTIVIRNAPVDRLRDYYRANYRPDRATLVVVGDIEPTALEAEIRRRFGDWTSIGPAKTRRNLGTLRPHHSLADILTTGSGAALLEFAWIRPHDQAPDTRALRRQRTIRDIGLHILARRLDVLAHQTDTPFLRIKAGEEDLLKSADMIAISALVAPIAWQRALAAIEQEQRRIGKSGALQPELERELQNERAALQTAAAGEATRPTTTLADGLMASTAADKTFISPADTLALFDDIAKRLTTAEVNKALQRTFSVKDLRIILQTPEAPFGREATIDTAYKTSRATAVSGPASTAIPSWPYTSFGPPGVVSETHAIEDLGITLVRFANGVHLAIKPTKFNDGEVLVRADIGRGRRDLPLTQQKAAWAAAAFIPGGLKAISYDEMWQALPGKEVSIRFSFNDEAFVLQGKTRTEDLATQMQMLAAYTSVPAFRPQAFIQVQEAYKHGIADRELTAGSIADRYLPGLLHAGDPRWAAPDQRQISSTTPADFEAQFGPYLSSGPINVSIVGDVTVDDAIRLTSATFGALPVRSTSTTVAPAVHFPAPTKQPVVLNQLQRPDNAAALLAAPIGDLLSDLPRTYSAKVAVSILLDRVIAQFRRNEGATYTPRANAVLSEVLPDYGYAYVYVETASNEVKRFYEIAEKILGDLRTEDVTPDELARAKQALFEDITLKRQRNDHWLSQLSEAQADARYIDFLRSNQSGYENVTAQTVRAIAQVYFTPDKFWKFEVLPGSSTMR
ncbi:MULTISPECIES: M16 family metallopeptidase [unclassified Rhizobium]|uniref:M16 family metallopeptidase n=1 Tax=unclassified Rhizobium TaxID=2613769 RepID=UPI000EAA8A0D|nr:MULTISPECIES: M16 family metallopeptidase [unclassified Rhizobium]AYG69740.1 insulinase family protein [Rhizobium sp. CCGE531]AYG76115.1 insulinase family protein [Rhizobium sp. CCGE532]